MMERKLISNSEIPLYELIDGEVGPFHRDLIVGWIKNGIGGKCPRCDDEIYSCWGLPSCWTCERARLTALGCQCNGLNLCPKCQDLGATEKTRGEIKCEKECSTLCPICSPDD